MALYKTENYNVLTLDADNITITAGELMEKAGKMLVFMVKTQVQNFGGVIVHKRYIDRLIECNDMDGYTFKFNSGTVTATYVASSPDDIIELQQ